MSTRTLDTGDTSLPEAHDLGDGWNLEDVGRVRGASLSAQLEGPAGGMESDGDDARGDNPDNLVSGLREKPVSEIADHTDVNDDDEAPTTAAEAEAEMAAGGKPKADAKKTDEEAPPADEKKDDAPGKRTLPGRVETMRKELGKLAAERRTEVAAVARLRAERMALEAGTKPAAPAAQPAADAAPARAKDGKFAAKPIATEAPVIPPAPVWKDFEDADKPYEEFDRANRAYLEATIEARAYELRKEIEAIKGDAAGRSEREAKLRLETAFETRMDAAKAALKPEEAEAVINAWDDVEAIPFLEDVIRLHPNGANLYFQLGKQIDRAAVLATYDWTKTTFDAVMATNDPTALLLHLADNPDEFTRIVQLNPTRALVELGRLDASLVASAGKRDLGPRPVSVSKAPKPIRPVGGTRSSTPSSDDPLDMEFGPEYVAKRNAQDRERRGYGT